MFEGLERLVGKAAKETIRSDVKNFFGILMTSPGELYVFGDTRWPHEIEMQDFTWRFDIVWYVLRPDPAQNLENLKQHQEFRLLRDDEGDEDMPPDF